MPTVPRRKRKAEKETSVDITSFFISAEERKVEKEEVVEKTVERKEITKPEVTEQAPVGELQNKILEYIRLRGKVVKSDLYKWSKLQKITPADLYRALINLEKRGLIKKVFDPQSEELAYVAA